MWAGKWAGQVGVAAATPSETETASQRGYISRSDIWAKMASFELGRRSQGELKMSLKKSTVARN